MRLDLIDAIVFRKIVTAAARSDRYVVVPANNWLCLHVPEMFHLISVLKPIFGGKTSPQATSMT